MPTKDKKILKYNDGEKSLKAPFIIIFDLEPLLKTEQSCQNNPEKSYTARKAKDEPSDWAMFKKCSFDKEKNRFDYYRGIDSIEKGCEKFKGRTTEIINHKEKEMISLTDKENNSHGKQKAFYMQKRILL